MAELVEETDSTSIFSLMRAHLVFILRNLQTLKTLINMPKYTDMHNNNRADLPYYFLVVGNFFTHIEHLHHVFFLKSNGFHTGFRFYAFTN